MTAPLNQFSLLLASTAAVGAVLLVLRRRWRLRRTRRIAALALVAASILAWATLRTGAGGIASPRDLDAAVGYGRPVVLELYSDYCVACLRAKPVVDGLALEFRGRATVLRADIRSDAGRVLAARHDLTTVPAFVVFGPDGAVVFRRDGSLSVPVVEIRRAIRGLKAPAA